MGLRHQSFEFDGKTDTWYASVATTQFQWNMKLHAFENCVGQEGMYVTSLGMSVDRKSGGSHNILISIADENQVFPGCQSGLCLGDGSLRIEVDGQVFQEPGDHSISSDLRIVTYNTWSACSRKWWDYDAAMSTRSEIEFTDGNDLFRKLQRHGKSLFRKNRDLITTIPPLDFLLNSREYMSNPASCSDWIQRRVTNNDLFQQLGGWSTIFIETPHVSFQVEYRQINRETLESELGGGSGGPEDVTIEGVTFLGTQNTCEAHVLDAWLTHSSPGSREETWYGIVGETKTSPIQGSESVLVNDRYQVIKGDDSSYEVQSPFDRGFVAKQRRNLRKQWIK